jgi:hypothetical protein
MAYYPLILTLHITFFGIWSITLITNPLLKGFIKKRKGSTTEKTLISLYLILINRIGLVGASGILITGILLVVMNPGYDFFQMSANHWLTTKQILMALILLLIVILIIPTAKKLRKKISDELMPESHINEESYSYLKKIEKVNSIINTIIIINFLLAITHRYFS